MLDPTKKKKAPHAQRKGEAQQDGRRDEITFKIKPHTEGSSNTLHTPGDPTETEADLILRV